MIDSHAHLDHSAFDEDRNEVIDNLKRDGVDLVFNVGSSIKSSRNCIALAEKYENIYAVVGVHPADILGLDDKAISELKEMAMHEKVVAIGEIGLDYYYEDNPPRELQIEAFKRQLDLACELDMPVAIHTRDAEEDTYNILKSQKYKYENFSALLHSYPGDVELMEKYLQLGFYISLNGITTFKNGTLAQSVAKAIPLNRLVLETDCPYLSPTPFRGKRNEPKRVRNTAEYIAVLKGISFDKLVENTDRNTLDFYRL